MNKKLANCLGLLLLVLASVMMPVSPASSAPLTPQIESAYAESSTSISIIFYGKVATVGDLPTTYTATSNPDGKSSLISVLGEGGRGVITVAGLKADTSYTFTIRASNSAGNSANSNESAPVRTLKAAFIPTFSDVVSTSTGFTTTITNFDREFTHSISVDRGLATVTPFDGSINIQNIGNPGESATATLRIARTGYDTAVIKLTGKSRSTNEPHRLVVLTNPVLTQNGDNVSCSLGNFNFLRNGKLAETAKIATYTVTLIVDGKRVGIVSSDNFATLPRFLFPDVTGSLTGTVDSVSARWNVATLSVKTPVACEVAVFQEQTSLVAMSNSLPATPVRVASRARTITCVKGTTVRKVLGKNPRCPRGFTQQ